MTHGEHLEIPHGDRPEYLEGLELPATTEEALEYAEAHGAPPEALAFMESLPAAVFTSETGLRHAFSTLTHRPLPETDPEHVLVGEDGISS